MNNVEAKDMFKRIVNYFDSHDMVSYIRTDIAFFGDKKKYVLVSKFDTIETVRSTVIESAFRHGFFVQSKPQDTVEDTYESWLESFIEGFSKDNIEHDWGKNVYNIAVPLKANSIEELAVLMGILGI